MTYRHARRTVLSGLLATLALPFCRSAFAEKNLPDLVLWGPPAGPSITLAHAQSLGMLKSLAPTVTFKIWRSPDELRAGLTSGTMKLFILPTQTAANLYNRNLGVRLVNVMTNGLLYIVSGDETLSSVSSLKGRTVSVPYRNDTPDVIFRRLLAGHGMEAGKDITLQFAGTPLESVQFLLTGRVDAALLPEPAVTAAIAKAAERGKPLKRTINIQQAWGRVTGLGPVLPQAGFGVSDDFLSAHRPIVEALQHVMMAATVATNLHPEQAADAASAALGFPSSVIAESIPHSSLVAVRASDARPSLEEVYKAVAEVDPKIIGGTLPSDAFYF